LVLESILKAYGWVATWGAKGKLEMWGDIVDTMDIDLKLQATKLLMKILGTITTRLQLLFHMYFTIFNSNPKGSS